MKTIKIKYGDLNFDKYYDQIESLIRQRYENELKYNSNVPIEFLLKGIELIVSIDNNDNVFTVSGLEDNGLLKRVKLFASKTPKIDNVKEFQLMLGNHFNELLSEPNTFLELSIDLFQKLERMIKLFKREKSFNVNLYYLPAEESVKLLPGRKILVSDNGVSYFKRVVGANTFAEKICISNSPNINGAIGYSSLNEASNHSNYKNKLIIFKGKLIEIPFNKEMWGI